MEALSSFAGADMDKAASCLEAFDQVDIVAWAYLVAFQVTFLATLVAFLVTLVAYLATIDNTASLVSV